MTDYDTDVLVVGSGPGGLVALIHEAAANGASLVAFPEAFVPGYPYWNWTMNPVDGSPWYERLYRSSIDVPGPHVESLRAAARAANCTVVIGVNGLAYLALFFLTPFVSLILTSLQTPVEFGDVGQFQQAFKIENYATVIGQYWPHFLRAFEYFMLVQTFGV